MKRLPVSSRQRAQAKWRKPRWEPPPSPPREPTPRPRQHIPDDIRLAVFLRDGLRCVYCGLDFDPNATEENRLTLDHVDPWSQSYNSAPSNLVTACSRCNAERGALSLPHFCSLRAINPATIREAAMRRIPIEEAREMIRRKGGVRGALSRRTHGIL